MKIILAVLFILLVGCTDADWDSLAAYGDSALVECYSGGKKVFTATTTGKVVTLYGGGGWGFRTTENVYVQTYADCFVSVK